MSRDDTSTVVPCAACNGGYQQVEELPDGKYRATVCRWCTQGGMDQGQILAWARHERERREAGRQP